MATVLGSLLVALGALVHVALFLLKSVFLSLPAVWRLFGLADQDAADGARGFGYSQGFYDLFFAAGVLLGLLFQAMGLGAAGFALVLFSALCMVLGAVVLLTTGRRALRLALVQGVPPLLGLGLLFAAPFL